MTRATAASGGCDQGAGAVSSTPRLARKGEQWTWNYDLPQSIGRVRAFYGNLGVLVRALAYITGR